MLVDCLPSDHPLSKQGKASLVVDTDYPIYAVDLLDDEGRPVLPRQEPYEKVVRLLMVDADEPDEGAYVDVQVTPSQALRLVPADDTCEQLAGAFRCTGGEDGYATFVVRSESDWSGVATIELVGRPESKNITVKPAGLPASTPGFTMVIGEGGQQITKVPATFGSLACHLGPLPTDPYDKWPAGRVRARPAVIRATPPPQTPSVVVNAPVIVESLSSEAALSFDPTCPAPPTPDAAAGAGVYRQNRLRLQLDQVGLSPSFYVCFSDVGGEDVRLVFRSGELVNETTYRQLLTVEPEPRLLRVTRLQPTVYLDAGATPVVEVTAYDANLDLVEMQVDVASSDPTVLSPTKALWVLSDEGTDPTAVEAYPFGLGSVTFQVVPRLLVSPACTSESIEVTESGL
jgi:hypothetical protein